VALTLSSVLRRAPQAQFSRFGADLVVLDAEGRTLRGFNPAAARIWSLLDGQHSVEAIARAVSGEFQVAYERALADALFFLGQLREKALVEEGRGA
jgi:pyrroloquinoline quinone biosynthesis protein D